MVDEKPCSVKGEQVTLGMSEESGGTEAQQKRPVYLLVNQRCGAMGLSR